MRQSPIEKSLCKILLLNIPDQTLHDLKSNFIGRNLKKGVQILSRLHEHFKTWFHRG